ncbi:MAG: TlpA disulfide reductase family protein [Chloroflexota bacterium]
MGVKSTVFKKQFPYIIGGILFLCLVCCVCAAVVALAVYLIPVSERSDISSSPKPGVDELPEPATQGEQAPDFELESYTGRIVHLSETIGNPVLVNFWSLSCSPCVEEMPLFQEVTERYAGTLVILTVNSSDDQTEIADFMAENEYTFEVLMDPRSRVMNIYGVSMIPMTYFLDPESVIQAIHIGTLTAWGIENKFPLIGLDQ